ncbi:MAG TPA: Gfo/Idh/MocA family oxidoreductase [Verrucomicrobiae bacterium]
MSSYSPSRLRAALIGCGRIGAHTPDRLRQTIPAGWIPVNHAEAMQANSGLELVAVCDARQESAETTAKEMGVAAAFTDYRQMIQTVKPDIVSIATRTEGRCEIVAYAAQQGVRGIHVDKPLGRSMVECRKALQSVEQHGTKLSYGTTRRCMDVFRLVKSLIAAGEIGELRQITIELGRAALLWSHPHSFDLMVYFATGREALGVQGACEIAPDAVKDHLIDADPIIENASVRFSGGLNAVITTAPGLNVRFAGDLGLLTVGADGSWLTREKRTHTDRPYHGLPERIPFTPQASGTQRAFAELIAAVNGTGQPSITPAEVLLSNQLSFAVAWSALNGGQQMTLRDIPEDLTITGRQGQNYA